MKEKEQRGKGEKRSAISVQWSNSVCYSEQGEGIHGIQKDIQNGCPNAEELNGKKRYEPTEKRIWVG